MSAPWIKPRRLQRGDLVAVLSPSWGGPARFPATFEAGLRTLAQLGLRVREYPSTRAWNATVEERVRDLHAAFADDEVRAIVASIGGDDAVLLLPHLDATLIRSHAKIVMGYSDTCALLAFLHAHQCIAFHGPSVMAGLAQAQHMPPRFLEGLESLLFQGASRRMQRPFAAYCDGYETWSDPANSTRTKAFRPNEGPRLLRGEGTHQGRLWGGCIEVLEMVKGTPWWPRPEAWRDAVVLLEGSEESPPPSLYARVLRSWRAAGHLERIGALLVGRPAGYDLSAMRALDAVITQELAHTTQPLIVLSGCDFGHTDPQWLLPLGATVEVDARGWLTVIEPCVV